MRTLQVIDGSGWDLEQIRITDGPNNTIFITTDADLDWVIAALEAARLRWLRASAESQAVVV
jgi:hypothetical protein